MAGWTARWRSYVYDAQGRATWYLSAGNLTPSTVGGTTYYNVYNGALDGYANGQMIGGPYHVPNYFANAGGPVSIIFDPTDETRATLTWGGRTTQIQRSDYYSGFGAADREIQRMIGEWSVVVDLYSRGGDYANYPYYGDVLVFDTINRTPTPDFFEGCRADTSLAGFCSNNANTYHDAAGYYDAARDEHAAKNHAHVAIVTDFIATNNSPAGYWAYYLDLNVSDFEGVVELYTTGQTSGDGPYYPVRGFRSASRSFVLTGAGPNVIGPVTTPDAKAAALDADTAIGPHSLAEKIKADNGGVMPAGLTADEVKARFGIDVKAHRAKVREMAETLAAKHGK